MHIFDKTFKMIYFRYNDNKLSELDDIYVYHQIFQNHKSLQ